MSRQETLLLVYISVMFTIAGFLLHPVAGFFIAGIMGVAVDHRINYDPAPEDGLSGKFTPSIVQQADASSAA